MAGYFNLVVCCIYGNLVAANFESLVKAIACCAYNNVNMNVVTFENAVHDTKSALQFMRERHLISDGVFCYTCVLWKTHKVYPDRKVDGYIWRCDVCYSKTSIRHGSFFSGQRLPLQTVMWILYLFAKNISLTQAFSMCDSTIYVTDLSWMVQHVQRFDVQGPS